MSHKISIKDKFRFISPIKLCTECGYLDHSRKCAEQGWICIECWPITDSWEEKEINISFNAIFKKENKK